MRTSNKKWRLLVVDDHPIAREGCAHLIAAQPDMEVAGEASGVREALEFFSEHTADVALVDLTLQDGHGLDLVERLSAEQPHMPVLVWSAREESYYAERALEAGAKGYINKRALSNTLVVAIRTVTAGKTYLSEESKELILSRRFNAASASPLAALSNREMEIYEFIGDGRTVKEIAELLCLSSKTVNSYRDRIKIKLGLSSSNELGRHAFQWALEGRKRPEDQTPEDES